MEGALETSAFRQYDLTMATAGVQVVTFSALFFLRILRSLGQDQLPRPLYLTFVNMI